MPPPAAQPPRLSQRGWWTEHWLRPFAGRVGDGFPDPVGLHVVERLQSTSGLCRPCQHEPVRLVTWLRRFSVSLLQTSNCAAGRWGGCRHVFGRQTMEYKEKSLPARAPMPYTHHGAGGRRALLQRRQRQHPACHGMLVGRGGKQVGTTTHIVWYTDYTQYAASKERASCLGLAQQMSNKLVVAVPRCVREKWTRA